MSAGDDRREDLLRRFEAAIAGAELDDLRRLAVDLSVLGEGTQQPAEPLRPELRRAPLREMRVFRARVDLKGSKPPIWRRLDLRSDITLDSVHKALQVAFGWTDTHLWRFSLGGDPFGRSSQLFLCEWDVDEGEMDDAGGVPATEVRLDETIQDPGDVLCYVYDYGDSWELRLKLEDTRLAGADAALAVAVDGRRAAPPEDCGGITDGDELAEILEDPEAFDLDSINTELRTPFMVLVEHGFDRRLRDLVWRLAHAPVADDLSRRTIALIHDPGSPDEGELRSSFKAFTWFLDRAAKGGIELTAAGYLKPIDVTAAAQVLPTMGDWIGMVNRQSETAPVLHFRQCLQSLGLLRRYKGALVLTRAGAAAQQAHAELWNLLADKLVPASDGFETDATLLMLVYAATSANAPILFDDVAAHSPSSDGAQGIAGLSSPMICTGFVRSRSSRMCQACNPAGGPARGRLAQQPPGWPEQRFGGSDLSPVVVAERRPRSRSPEDPDASTVVSHNECVRVIIAGVYVGALEIEIHIPSARSLKEKRSVVRHLVETARQRFGVSASEVAHHDRWQRAGLGFSVVAPSAAPAQRLLEQVERFVWSHPEFEVISAHRHWVETSDNAR